MMHVCENCVWAIEHEEEVTVCHCPLYDYVQDCFYVSNCEAKKTAIEVIKCLYGETYDPPV
jgi:hypothetical protein